MCLAKTPKVVSAPTSTDKDAAILRNPYLDGLATTIRARQGGLKSLIIRRLGGGLQTPALPTTPLIPLTPTTGGNTGGSSGGGSSYSDPYAGGNRTTQRDISSNLTIQKAKF